MTEQKLSTSARVLAIIPARGGSKRLPRKNVLPFNGKPLIAWTIEAAKKAETILDICVSSDDEEILEVARHYGVDVALQRPAELSDDTASTIDVLLHVVGYLRENQREYDYVVLLQPTSPLRTPEDIDAAMRLALEERAQTVVALCECEHSPLWTNTIPEDGSLDGFLRKEVHGKRSQDLPKYYRISGAVYISTVENLLQSRTFFPESGGRALVLPANRSIDIDTAIDFDIANLIASKGQILP